MIPSRRHRSLTVVSRLNPSKTMRIFSSVWISHDKVAPDTVNWQRPKSPPGRWERYAQKPLSRRYQNTSTLIEGDTSLFVALDRRVGDLNLWSPPFQCWRLRIPPSMRVFEVHGPEDWNRLCVRYPAEGTKDGPPDLEWLVPDWGAAAEEWDGVHVSLGGLLTTERVRYESEGGVSMLLFTESELTYWLRGFPSAAEGLPDRYRKDGPTLRGVSPSGGVWGGAPDSISGRVGGTTRVLLPGLNGGQVGGSLNPRRRRPAPTESST